MNLDSRREIRYMFAWGKTMQLLADELTMFAMSFNRIRWPFWSSFRRLSWSASRYRHVQRLDGVEYIGRSCDVEMFHMTCSIQFGPL